VKTGKDITKSLYEKEGDMNGFEEIVINQIATFRQFPFGQEHDRKGFCINGFGKSLPPIL